jgi:hypothetical protein
VLCIETGHLQHGVHEQLYPTVELQEVGVYRRGDDSEYSFLLPPVPQALVYGEGSNMVWVGHQVQRQLQHRW